MIRSFRNRKAEAGSWAVKTLMPSGSSANSMARRMFFSSSKTRMAGGLVDSLTQATRGSEMLKRGWPTISA